MYNGHPYLVKGKKSDRFYLKYRLPNLIYRLFRLIGILWVLRQHYKLIRVLKPFKQYPLISQRTRLIYLFSYLSNILSTREKLEILTEHYRFINEALHPSGTKKIFEEGITCWSETINGNHFSVKLAHSSYLEFEGSLCLLFSVNGDSIYKLAFTISSGTHFGISNCKIIYVSSLQGTTGKRDIISHATKTLNDLIPSTILISVLEGIGVSLGIKTIIGTHYKYQPAYSKEIGETHYNNYDFYWQSQGGTLMPGGNYLFSCPLECKPIESIKAKYRSRTINKRARRAEIATNSNKSFSSFLKKENTYSRKVVTCRTTFLYLPALFKLSKLAYNSFEYCEAFGVRP